MSEAEWAVDVLDLDAYLERIGRAGGRRNDITPAELHRAHTAAIPFENLDVILGRGVSVELEDVQEKLVGARRGGYCYEHGVLFGAVLERLGFRVDRLLARIGGEQERPRPRTHMVLVVGDGATRWLADVGFGSGLLEPLLLRSGASAVQGAWTYQLEQSATGAWTLRERSGGEWIDLYNFREETQHFSDIVMSNHYTATWPDSPFVRQAVVVRKDETEVRRLLGSRLSRTRPGRPDDIRDLDDSEIGPELRRLGIELAQRDLEVVIGRLRAP